MAFNGNEKPLPNMPRNDSKSAQEKEAAAWEILRDIAAENAAAEAAQAQQEEQGN
jgi:hypothetical protein